MGLSDSFPKVAGHLLSASILLAPAAILASKLIIPETGKPITLGTVVKVEHQKANNAVESIINGSMAGLKMVGTASIVPERTKDISVLGLWALLASNMACFITGAVAGVFYTGGGSPFLK